MDYKKIISDFADEHSFLPEAKEELLREFTKLKACKDAFESFEKYVKLYNEDKLTDFDEPHKIFKENFEEKSGVHRYSWCMLFLICLTPHAHELYMKVGVSEKVYFDSMSDLLWKIRECHDVYGIWGTFVYDWYPRFFRADRFAFGRLQFETGGFSYEEYSCDAYTLKKGDPIIRIHIPGAGKLSKELCLDSLAQAAKFYGDQFKDKPLVFTTHSWLLTPYHYDFLKCCPNVLAFMDLFDIIGFDNDPKGSDLWRIFNIKGELDLDKVPADTSMRRAYIDYLKKGGKTGWGYGLIYWDKENNCPQKYLNAPII